MPKLYIVPTPVGNLEDMTLRGIRILSEADFIIAEDTRKTGLLLKHFNIGKKRLYSHHQHNEHATYESLLKLISGGQTAALVSNAGTPVISDPGYLLLRACIRQGIEVECLPGPTSVIPALILSGLPAERFFFEGFLPHKKGRTGRLSEIAGLSHTVIIFESPNRLMKTLQQLATLLQPDRQLAVSRELSKIYEETIRGTVQELIAHFSNKTIKGEIILLIEGKKN